nr:winged helix DNA-binding domain-containing protein [uncultured Methanobacterium sp.]
MKQSEIALERLHNQQLTSTKFKKPVELISWMGAIQGQDYPGAKWAVGLRLPESTDVIVAKAIEDKAIFRTWLMRGTLHLVAAEDIHWMLTLMAPRIIKSNTRRYRELGLDDKTLKQSNYVLKHALEGGNELNRKELLVNVQENGISTEGQRAPYMLQRASLDGIICQCGVERNNPLYMSMDSVPKTDLTREEALAELARRYFKSRGPATLKDFIWWSGLLAADARTGLTSVKSDLTEETVDGKTYWYYKATQQNVTTMAHLLPTYDEYLFGYQDRSASMNKTSKRKLQDVFRSTIAVNGQIVGTWKRTFKKDAVLMECNPFRKLTKAENDALTQAVLRYGEFMGLPVIIS